MNLADEIRSEVRQVFRSQWTTRDGEEVPDTENVKLGNEAVKLAATVLYADLADSTVMVDKYKAHFCAEVFKAFLIGACRIIRANGGEITAFDGDRVMAVFIGEQKNTTAAKTALQIKWLVQEVINEELKAQYADTDFVVRHGVGVDTSSLWVERAGIRGSNDLVWVGRAANYAAKLCSLADGAYSSWITKDVFDLMNDSSKYGKDGRLMWEERMWTARGFRVYRSNWRWPL